MTAIVTTHLGGEYLLLHGDTIVTYIYKNKSLVLPHGLTTTQEALISDEIDNETHVYAEKVCKVGILSTKLSCAIAGNAELAFDVLENLYELGKNLRSKEELSSLIFQICNSLQPAEKHKLKSCTIQFISSFQSLESLIVDLEVQDDGSFKHRFQVYSNLTQPFHKCDGSGISHFRTYFPQSVLEGIMADPELHRISAEMISADYVNFLRFKNQGTVKGVGGIVLGLKHSLQSIQYMGDMIFLYADYRQSVEVCVKVIYRKGCFFITDFINKYVEVLRTVEEEIEFRLGNRHSIDLSSELKEALTFQTPLMFLDIREKNEPFLQNVMIVRNNESSGVISKLDLEVQFDDGFPYIPKGVSLEIKTESGVFNLQVKKD